MSRRRRSDEYAQLRPEQRAELLKERVYVTFTSLAVVLTLSTHADELHPGQAAFTLFVTVLGTLLAVFVADFTSHLAVHAHFPARDELRHMVRVSADALGVIVLPFLFMGLAALHVMTLPTALRVATITLLASLVAIGYLAIRRAKVTPLQRIVVLLAEFALGAAVVGLELLAHGE